MKQIKRLLCFGIFWGLSSFGWTKAVFTPEENDRIKATLNQMTGIVEGLHTEVLEMDQVLNASSTAMRKARVKERLKVRLDDMESRLQDLRRLRLTFIKVPQLKEFMIALDDRLKVMEQNASLVKEIHLPQVLETMEGEGAMPHFSTFINPGDPRYRLEEDQKSLAQAIDRGGHLLGLRDAALREDGQFTGFMQSLDASLKSTDKPEIQTIPTLGRQSLDEFHQQLVKAQAKDPTFDWNEDRSDQNFRRFLQNVEGLNEKAMENVRVISQHPKVDEPNLAQSRQTFAHLMTQIDDQERVREKTRVVMESKGALKPIFGMNKWLNDIRLDAHKPAKQEFEGFLKSLEPIKSEIVLKASRVPARTLKTPVVESVSSEEFLVRLAVPHKHEELNAGMDGETDWDEDRLNQDFRRFLQNVEDLSEKDVENVQAIRQHPKVDEPNPAQSRQTVAHLMTQIDDQERAREKKRVVMEPKGALKPILGMNKWLNDIRLDTHKPTKQEFEGFLKSLEPVKSGVVLKASRVPDQTQKTPVVESVSSKEFLGRLAVPRKHEELNAGIDGETMHAVHVTKEAVQFPFQPRDFQEHQEMVIEYMGEYPGPVEPKSRPSGPRETGMPLLMHPAGQFENYVAGVQGGLAYPELVAHRLQDDKSLIPITLTLLDQDRVPYSDTLVQFELDLSEVPWGVRILEGMSRDPKRHRLRTNTDGEAQVHLLAEVPQGQKLQVKKLVSPTENGVVCHLKVLPDGMVASQVE